MPTETPGRKAPARPRTGQALISRFFKPRAAGSSQAPVRTPAKRSPRGASPHSDVACLDPAVQVAGTPDTSGMPTPALDDGASQSPEATAVAEKGAGGRKRRRLFVNDDDDEAVLVVKETQRDDTLGTELLKRRRGDPVDITTSDIDDENMKDVFTPTALPIHAATSRPQRRTRVVPTDDVLSNDSDDAHAVVPDDAEDENGASALTTQASPKRKESHLLSFGLIRDDGVQIAKPRNSERQRQFSLKVGRLEKDSFFVRRTGGAGGGDELPQSLPGPDSRSRTSIARDNNKHTPLEAQFVKIRKENPGMVLLIECGYKYRLFDDHATLASKILRIFAYFDHNFMTASFPVVRMPYHVRRLVQAGHKVGIVRQSETAALKKVGDKPSKLFERKLCEVYSKGTIVADGRLNDAESGKGKSSAGSAAAYIMAVREIDVSADDDEAASGTKMASDSARVSVAAVDAATGEVLFDIFADDALRSDLEARLVALEPVEVILPVRKLSTATERVLMGFCESTSARLERVPDSFFRSDDELAKVNCAVNMQYHGKPTYSKAVSTCLGALASYLEQFQLQIAMVCATEYKSFSARRQMTVGADVLNNFEVFCNSNDGSRKYSLLALLDRTQTAFGSRQMRRWLAHPLVEAREIQERLDVVEALSVIVDGNVASLSKSRTVHSALDSIIVQLTSLPDLERGLARIACRKCPPAEFCKVIGALESVSRDLDRLKTLVDSASGASLPVLLSKMVDCIPNVSDLLTGGIVSSLNRQAALINDHNALFANGISLPDDLRSTSDAQAFIDCVAKMQSSDEEVKTCENQMDDLLAKFRKKFKNKSWNWKKVANEEYLLEVPVAKAGAMPRSWTIVCQTKAMKRFRAPEAADGFECLARARETRDIAAADVWQSYLTLFQTVCTPLRSVVRFLADLDCLAALGRVANLPGYVKPEVVNDSNNLGAGIEALDARHPITEALANCESYVPNDVRLGRGEFERALVISGPNYGGKSSYSRMTALLVILAQVGSFVPAKRAKLSPFDSIFARMGSADAIAKGMSSLMVELAETANILRTATSKSLVVLDELGRGTSTHDGAAVAYATLSHLVAETQCVTLFVTHYPVLASLCKVHPGSVGAYFMDYIEEKSMGKGLGEASPEAKRITFLYKLTSGVASSSYGLNVATLAEIPPDVIALAARQAEQLEKRMRLANQEMDFRSIMLPSPVWESREEQPIVDLLCRDY